ncbi:hypothetical protein EYF80_006352 [Liparis tanakae]|uniref:Uncharacterized protein n=1 Tax=Liparis tanakae TaxID=230148 RepID=A0A4Z2J0A8_9TELE|nr:hypothetical protein EYF80_006352 [Liparis tanakae]
MASEATQVTADSRGAELDRELAAVLKDTLGDLQKLESFLDALENLALSSLHVFTPEKRVLRLPERIRTEDVQLNEPELPDGVLVSGACSRFIAKFQEPQPGMLGTGPWSRCYGLIRDRVNCRLSVGIVVTDSC